MDGKLETPRNIFCMCSIETTFFSDMTCVYDPTNPPMWKNLIWGCDLYLESS